MKIAEDNQRPSGESRMGPNLSEAFKRLRRQQQQQQLSGILLVAVLLVQTDATSAKQQQQAYYGSLIGKLNGRSHNVSGEVYAVDEQTLFIKDFNYDGQAPDAYFWSSTSANQQQQQQASPDGFIVPDEKGSTKPLERYVDKDIVLRLPEGKTLREINWLSVWSRANKLSSGEIMISRQLQTPRPLEIGPFSSLAHGIKSGPITIVDAQTFLVPDFHYDGLGPEAYFWLTRGSSGLGPSGLKLKDENGAASPLRKYSGETVVISLPDDLTIHDFDFFGIWCVKYQVNFGQVRIPQAARVPPSPKMLGIKPENKLNCEILYDDLGYEIRWVLDGDDIVMQLVGKIELGEYMAFGLGKDDSKSDMQNADAVVAWVDRGSGQVHAVDYYLGAKQQCVNDPRGGSCPDSKLPGGGDSLTLLHGAIVNGYSMVTFKRPQLGVDEQYDQHVYSDGQQSVLWAIGSLNKEQEIGYHRLRTKSNMFIDFARNPQWNCPIPDLNASMHTNLPIASASQLESTVISASEPQKSSASNNNQQAATSRQPADWFIPSLVCPPERTFYAQLGPTGGRKGYEARTGHTGWGQAWYVNGIMIPELVIERGTSYRFVVEGGSDKTSASRRHPFYLTDSPEGGFDFKTDDERLKERIFAGVALRGDGQFVPTAEGRLCEWKPSEQMVDPDSYQTFAAYQRSLKLECAPGQAAILKFTPDVNTPDQLYYQCYTHRFMGWRVRVVDSCSEYLKGQQHNLSMESPTGGQNPPIRRSSNNLVRQNYERRYSLDDELIESASSPSLALDQMLINAVKSMAESRQSLFDFGDEAAATALATTELTTFPSDMIILNSSVLNQRQPFNMSTIEQILRFSPSDLEFLGSPQTEEPIFQTPITTVPYPNLQHLNGGIAPPPFKTSTPPLKISSNNKNKKRKNGNKQQQPAATWNSYIRRLASIYYPVQQQLTSMLSSSQPPANPSNGLSEISQTGANQIVAAPSEGSFSLSSLVSKPKIDLTKSGISKKLNKFRFSKSGGNQKQEKLSQPPTPAIEFNYDIFNNQLAQLEKQQKQLQSMEMLTWPPQQQSALVEPFAYGPMIQSASAEQPHMVYHQPNNRQIYNTNDQMMQKTRVQVPQHEVQAYRQMPIQQPFYPPQPQRPMQQVKLEHIWPPEEHQLQQQRPLIQQQHQEQSVYVTRVPQISFNTNLQQQQQVSSVRYPNIQPYNGHTSHYQPQPAMQPAQQHQQQQQQQQPQQQQMSSLPSVALTIHDAPNKEEIESLGSGSQYEFKQPVRLNQAESSSDQSMRDSDHMMAIERFSNPRQHQTNNVIEVSGTNHIEQFRLSPQAELTASASHQHQQSAANLVPTNNSTTPMNNNSQSRRYSNLLIDKNILASSEPTLAGGSPTNLLTNASTFLQTDPPTVTTTTAAAAAAAAATTTTTATTTELAPTNLVEPQNQPFLTTAPSVGPLIPSLGPPSATSLANGETVLKSTLVEPISSTLIQTPRQPPSLKFHLDSNPFTPIQLRPGLIYHSHLPIVSRFGPSILVESMFRHNQREPEQNAIPPVQVASYLAQQLAASSEKQFNQVQQANQTTQMSKSSPGDLIVLKPALLAKQNPQTYMLRPEHYSTAEDPQLALANAAHKSGGGVDVGGLGELGELGPTRRIAGRQFDRLSSLSSPPSTSIALDPLQADNSNNGKALHLQQKQAKAGNRTTGDNLTVTREQDEIQRALQRQKLDDRQLATATVTAAQTNQAQHRQSPIPNKPIPLNYDPSIESHLVGSNSLATTDDSTFNRPNPGGELISGSRNNQTDNAILSHVMSLISSNAIPTPPLIPVTSYSSADYFLPISDRIHRSIRG